ncbi:band 7 domain-containing protein [Auriscalpium vulgare]|uniref:Band 7 domain-containing protein n=1 Tax=Auriscalpium vulgare TaxID=40419 RepID=A0ACB8R6M4_9AGAM|nr:band 7 domain-containing protein [Auriscalpium vulgare]
MTGPVSDFGDASTVVGGRGSAYPKNPAYEKGSDDHHKIVSASFEVPHIEAGVLTKIEDYFAEQHPFVVKVGKDGLLAALQELDLELRNSGHDKILSKKHPTDWIGSEVNPGYLGLINHGGLPKLLTRPGRYPGSPIRNWWARKYVGTVSMSDSVITFKGLTVVQVSQNQAAVVSDPQNHIFIVKNSGFVAFGIAGSYDVLGIVDQTHLARVIKDHVTSAVLGYSQEVTMPASNSNNKQTYVVATFLNIPANNCAILQKGDDLELLPAGQHCITNPNVTLRGLYTLGENQFEMPTKDIFTRDQVPVSLTLYLKWQLTEPLKLATHGYQTPYDALRDKTQSILTQIVAHLDYSSMVKARSIGPDNMEEGADGSSQFLDALRTRAMDDLHVAALEYGIVLKDLAVIDRQFKGEIASTMDHLTKRALQAQVEAANVDRENSNKVKQEEGTLAVARIKAKARNTEADSKAYSVIAEAKAEAERVRIAAEAQAQATKLAAEAESEAIRIKANADAAVVDQFAREMEMRRMEVRRVSAFGNKAVFVPTEGMGVASPAMAGLAAGLGASLHK